MLLDGKTPPGWEPVQNHLAEAAQTAVWKCDGSVLFGDFTNLVRIARLISLFIALTRPGNRSSFAARSYP